MKPARLLQTPRNVRKKVVVRGGSGGSEGGSEYITTVKRIKRNLCRGAEEFGATTEITVTMRGG